MNNNLISEKTDMLISNINTYNSNLKILINKINLVFAKYNLDATSLFRLNKIINMAISNDPTTILETTTEFFLNHSSQIIDRDEEFFLNLDVEKAIKLYNKKFNTSYTNDLIRDLFNKIKEGYNASSEAERDIIYDLVLNIYENILFHNLNNN